MPTDLLYVISKRVAEGLGVTDDNAPIQKDRSGNTLYDIKNKYIVVLPSSESIKKYMEKEVLPYKPGSKAFFEETRSKGKIKTEPKSFFAMFLQTRTASNIRTDFRTVLAVGKGIRTIS